MEFIDKLLEQTKLSDNLNTTLSIGIKIILIIVLCTVAYLIAVKIVIRLISAYIKRSKVTWDDAFLNRKVFTKIARLIPTIIIYLSAPTIPRITELIERVAMAFIFLNIAIIISATINAINDIYMSFPVSKLRPIKGLLQIVKIIVYAIVATLIVATIIDKSPLIFLSSIGALTAITTLVFKDSILGFVAGIQLTSNDMLRIGDWIEMPKYGADGDVVEITLTTVKVKNWDKTITTIPTYALVSDSFKNWRGMTETGGRRIKRSIYIDTTSIKFCSPEMIEKFRKIQLLSGYIDSKVKEISKYNEENNIDTSLLVNGRHMTNIGTFRKYIESYLDNHPLVHKGLTKMVRQLPPGETGLPLEIYVFINDIAWVAYENAQSDIFDHILAVASIFDLRIFQNPSGHDLNNLCNREQ